VAWTSATSRCLLGLPPVEEANEEVPAEEALAEEDLVELEVLVGSDAEAVEPSVGEHTSTREICVEEPSTEEALVEAPAADIILETPPEAKAAVEGETLGEAEISTAEPPTVSWEAVPRKGNETSTDSTVEAAAAGEASKETKANS
jgi:hypothetical protein